MPTRTLRAFVALELSEDLRAALRRLSRELEAAMPPRGVRWIKPEALHVTLKFLGEISEARVSDILLIMQSAAQGIQPFDCIVSGLGCFPNARQPRIIWVGLHEQGGALTRLYRALEDGAARLGYAPEERPFSPHLTIGRVSRDAGAADLRRVGEVVSATDPGRLGRLDAQYVSLMKSELRPGGSVYTRIGAARLGGQRDTVG